jgi:hypothetical protein
MLLFNPPTAPYAQRFFEHLKAAASSIGVEAIASPVHDPAEIETVIAAIAREPGSGLIVQPSAWMVAGQRVERPTLEVGYKKDRPTEFAEGSKGSRQIPR